MSKVSTRNKMKFKFKNYSVERSALFVVLSFIVHAENGLAEIFGRERDFNDPKFGKVPMYFTFRSALNAFVREKQQNTYGLGQLAQFILTTFDTQCMVVPKLVVKAKVKKPFIAIESNHLSTRTILARRFARRIEGFQFRNPPVCLVHLKKFFPTSNPLVSAYFTLGMYAVAFKATVICDFKPVITTGYWHDKATFWLNMNCANTTLPRNTSTIYDFPIDLKVPDLMFYINFPDDLHRTPLTTRPPSNWKPRMLAISRMLRGVPMVELNSKMGFDNLLTAMENITTEILGKTRDFSFP